MSSPGHNTSRLGSQNFIVPIDLGFVGSIHRHYPAKGGGKLHELIDFLFTDNRWSCTAPVRLVSVTVSFVRLSLVPVSLIIVHLNNKKLHIYFNDLSTPERPDVGNVSGNIARG